MILRFLSAALLSAACATAQLDTNAGGRLGSPSLDLFGSSRNLLLSTSEQIRILLAPRDLGSGSDLGSSSSDLLSRSDWLGSSPRAFSQPDWFHREPNHAHGLIANSYGGTTFGPDGATFSSVGRTTFASDGTVFTRVGSQTFGSNGVNYSTVGKTTFGSDGTTYTRSGRNIFGSDGSFASVPTPRGSPGYTTTGGSYDEPRIGAFRHLARPTQW